MNRKMVFYMLGQILKLQAGIMFIPLITSLIYGEKEIRTGQLLQVIL